MTRKDPLALTDREIQLLILLGRGHSKPQVAQQLRLSPEIVRDRLNNACQRMGVTGTLPAVIEAIRRGLIEVGDGLVVVPKGAWDTAQEVAPAAARVARLLERDAYLSCGWPKNSHAPRAHSPSHTPIRG